MAGSRRASESSVKRPASRFPYIPVQIKMVFISLTHTLCPRQRAKSFSVFHILDNGPSIVIIRIARARARTLIHISHQLTHTRHSIPTNFSCLSDICVEKRCRATAHKHTHTKSFSYHLEKREALSNIAELNGFQPLFPPSYCITHTRSYTS